MRGRLATLRRGCATRASSDGHLPTAALRARSSSFDPAWTTARSSKKRPVRKLSTVSWTGFVGSVTTTASFRRHWRTMSAVSPCSACLRMRPTRRTTPRSPARSRILRPPTWSRCTLPGEKHPEWVYFDKKTSLIDRVDSVNSDGEHLSSTYDDYRTTNGLTAPWHIKDSFDHTYLDDDYKRYALTLGPADRYQRAGETAVTHYVAHKRPGGSALLPPPRYPRDNNGHSPGGERPRPGLRDVDGAAPAQHHRSQGPRRS